MGDPASLRVFRAGRNYFRLRMAGWGFTQVLALAGIIFWTTMLVEIERLARAPELANPETSDALKPDQVISPASTESPSQAQPARKRRPRNWSEEFSARVEAAANVAGRAHESGKVQQMWAGYKQALVEIARVLPPWAFPLVWLLKLGGIAAYLIQLPLTYAVRRLDYEMRWYMVTDRSLRLRHGVWKVTESTMSFANLQQVTVTQGPLQRVLGLATVKVQSAGGGGGGAEQSHHHAGEDMHVGLFHSVTNAAEIRDLILDRLRRYRESGLGDPDEKLVVTPAAATTPAATPRGTPLALAAAHELLAEARALKASVAT